MIPNCLGLLGDPLGGLTQWGVNPSIIKKTESSTHKVTFAYQLASFPIVVVTTLLFSGALVQSGAENDSSHNYFGWKFMLPAFYLGTVRDLRLR